MNLFNQKTKDGINLSSYRSMIGIAIIKCNNLNCNMSGLHVKEKGIKNILTEFILLLHLVVFGVVDKKIRY